MGATQQSDTIGELFSKLVEDANNVVHAEIGLYRASLLERLAMARHGLILLAAGAALLFCALLVLILGCLLALAQIIGPLFAGLALAAVSAIAGLILVSSGRKDVLRVADGRIGDPLPPAEERQA
jgi:hypothetical protein